jgi:hypothetical protein
MRPIIDMDTVQIEITNACVNQCSNCTRFCGHFKKPYFMDFDQFREAVNSMKGFPKMIGIMGGEPLLHPDFFKFCKYLSLLRIPKEQLGLWTTFPRGYEHYREIICEAFGNIFLNDQSRPDIYHCPILVAAEEVIPDRKEMFLRIEHCWLQENWSASINPKGAFFCEIAAAMSLLFKGSMGWKVEPGWWKRTVKDYKKQIEEFCPKCGAALFLPRRASIDGRDDISPKNLERLKAKSPKIKRGKYVISDLQLVQNPERMASYKDEDYRARIADRYGIFLVYNEKGFQVPYLKKNWNSLKAKKPLFEQFQKKYGS